MKKLFGMLPGAMLAMIMGLVSSQALAGLIDLRFSFQSVGSPSSGLFDGKVSGTIFGLAAPTADADKGTFAQRVVLDSWGTSPSVTFEPTDLGQNSFSLLLDDVGDISVASIQLLGLVPVADSKSVFLCLSDEVQLCQGATGLSQFGNASAFVTAVSSNVDFSVVPAPAPLILLLAGLLILVRSRLAAQGSTLAVYSLFLLQAPLFRT